MFFIMGINQGRKELQNDQLVICEHCGSYGRYQVFMTYMCLSLFFIPCFKWNRQYYVRTTCCNTVYALDPEVGKRIARGEHVEYCPGISHRYRQDIKAESKPARTADLKPRRTLKSARNLERNFDRNPLCLLRAELFSRNNERDRHEKEENL